MGECESRSDAANDSVVLQMELRHIRSHFTYKSLQQDLEYPPKALDMQEAEGSSEYRS